MTGREAIESAFTKPLADLIWTANTLTVLPITLQNFAVGPVLPAVFYMFRRGIRRGKGSFQATYSPVAKKRPNIYYVAGRLSQEQSSFQGFDSEIEKDILGDLLLCDSLENKFHSEGHEVEILRAFPVHFFSSWLDLPSSVANLRFVPEMLVALLANQASGRTVEVSPNGEFPVGENPQANILFQIFARGTEFCLNPSDLRGDSASEDAGYSIEELLMIRLAQTCGESPETLRATHGGMAEIPNSWPIAGKAADIFREDLSVFLRSFGSVIPRRAFTPMAETLLSLGIWHVFLSALSVVVEWDRSGRIPSLIDQLPFPVFVDASAGSDSRLRDISEQSNEDVLRLIDQAVTALAAVRILDAKARFDRQLREMVPVGPDATQWLNILGEVRMSKHNRSEVILNDLCEKMEALANNLSDAGIAGETVDILRARRAAEDPVRTLADSVCMMMGEKLLRAHYLKFLDSCLMINEPTGLGRKRRVSRSLAGGRRKMFDARSIVLSNTLLEALVHRHLMEGGGLLSFAAFVKLLRERYGLCVDEAPPGTTASHEDLARNRAILERRLRDLGLLIGVNDAESMKHLKRRYEGAPRS